jgi:hypothetical protein
VKTFSNDDSVARQTADFDVEVVKMHGSIVSSPQSDLVITQEDYEEFFVRRPATADLLKGHLLTKSFLFLGYSYRDTNIRNVLVQARRLATDAPRQHFLIAGKTDTLEKQKRQQLWSENLKRVGIEVVLMENFDRFDAVLAEIARVSRGNTVFITGSHKEASSNLASELGTLLAEQDMIVLIDGQSDGISRTAIASFVHTGVHQKKDIHNRLRIFPNPYAANPRFESDEDLLPELKKWRAPLIRATHVLVAFPGGMGTGTEVNLARELDCRIVPVPIEKNDSSALLMAAPEKYLSDEYKAKAANFQLTAAHIANEVKSLLCVTG